MVGNTYNQAVQTALQHESHTHNDIIHADFVESYHNLTIKVLVGIKWVLTYCSQTQYVVRTDDDMYSDVFVLLNMLHNHSNSMRSLMGRFVVRNLIAWDTRPCGLKFCVSRYDHPNLKYFPDYIYKEALT